VTSQTARLGTTDLERRVANLEKMIQVSRVLRSAFDLPTLLQQIIDTIVELANCEKSSILLLDAATGELRFAAAGVDYDVMKDLVVPRQGSIAGAIAETRQPVLVHDVYEDHRFFGDVDQVTGHRTRSIVGVPLEIGGRVIGVLQALNKREGQFDQEDVETLLMFASQAAAAIENTGLIEEQRERLTEVILLQDVLITLSRFIRMDQLLEQLLILLEEWLGYQNCAVLMYDKDRECLTLTAYRGFHSRAMQNRVIPVDGNSPSGRAATSLRASRIADVRAEPGLQPLLEDTNSALSVPLLCGEDVDLVGVISLESPDEDAFTEGDVRILSTIGSQAAIGIRQAELYEASRRANQLKQEFIATMSHELRTPMTVLIGYCDMLASESLGPLTSAQHSALKVVRDRSDLLLRLLNDVLDFSKIASGNLELHPVLVNLRSNVVAMVDKYSAYAKRKQQSVSIDIPQACHYVMADEYRLQQILGHLLENAIKFSPEGRPILIRANLYESSYVRVDVVDRGIGIRPEDLHLVFEDFRQLDNSFTREYGGAGMGLAVSKHLVELQGGLIWVESEFGEGSTFSFVLPRPEPSPNETLEIPSLDALAGS
jgi:signal transduction histidine kinase